MFHAPASKFTPASNSDTRLQILHSPQIPRSRPQGWLGVPEMFQCGLTVHWLCSTPLSRFHCCYTCWQSPQFQQAGILWPEYCWDVAVAGLFSHSVGPSKFNYSPDNARFRRSGYTRRIGSFWVSFWPF